jgi:hypothetical protein
MYVTKDTNGDPIDVKADVYEFLKTEAASIQRLSQVGARNAQKATQKTKANTLTPPARKPPEPKVDPDIESFDKYWDD